MVFKSVSLQTYLKCFYEFLFQLSYNFHFFLQRKARKTRRQILAEKTAAQQLLVNKANALVNPLDALPEFQEYITKNGDVIKLSCTRAKDAQPECHSWIFDVTERNVKDMYKRSSWGWDAAAKQAELTEEAAWYLVALSNDKFVGFSHFRFDIDHGEVVLYWYVQYTCEVVKNKTLCVCGKN